MGAGNVRLSVAMCTYNGAAYLARQLESIAGQTRPPDELVVCDDASTDRTAEIVRGFAAGAPFPVRLTVNERNLGTVGNFEQAIRLCRGEVIALADQDDVWLPEKLARSEAALAADPEAGLVFTDALVVDEELKPLGYRLWEPCFGRSAQRRVRRGRALAMLCSNNFVTGATLAFRARYRDLVLPIPTGTRWIHDGWIAALIAAVARLAFIDEPLMLYRRHAAQQVGAPPPGQSRDSLAERIADARRAQAEHFLALARSTEPLRERLLARGHLYPTGAALARLEERTRNLQARAALPSSRARRVPRVARELFSLRYHRYASGFLSAARDLLV
ncbi:MAG TPA: glycosyltransferase family 2 protein [Longimicrobium sp.]|jgi:glycosyltransferase involved in cell wall biosynthesis